MLDTHAERYGRFVEFRVLGPLECVIDGQAVEIGHPRRRCVLAVLIAEVNRPVLTEQLIDRVWGDEPPASVRNVLSGYVTRLRQVVGVSGDVAIRRQAGGYVLDVDPDRIDLYRFRDWVGRSRDLDAAPATELLNSALSLWRDKAFADMTSPWLRNLAETLEQERMAALLRRNDLALSSGGHAELLPELHELCGAYPLNERLAAQHMLALYRCGRQADALAAFTATRSVLAAELGLDPGQELTDLRQRILTSDPALTLRPAPAEAAPAWRVPQQLPAGTIDFTGRDAELSELDATGEEFRVAGAVPIVAIDGTAGVGKTALAIQFARRIAGRFPDGQLFARLRAHQASPPLTPLDVLTQFLRALGVPPEGIPLDVDEAAAAYRTLLADRRVLVVLDDASGPEQIRPLLPGNPGCAVLVTSRNRLNALVAKDGARRFTLGLLAEDAAIALLSRIVGERRVAGEPAAAAELTAICARLPLALRIAAANLAAEDTPITDYVSALLHGDRLGALEVDGDREAAVRTAFDLSYRALHPDARLLFRRLGVLPGPDFDPLLASVPASVDVAEADRLLHTLARAHLVETGTGGRYRCHDLLRIFAVERFTGDDVPDERGASRGRLFDFYLYAVDAVARKAYPQMLRLPVAAPPKPPNAPEFADHHEALAWLDVELPGVMALIAQAAEHGPYRMAWAIADSLRGYFWLRRAAPDWLAVATNALRAAEADDDPFGIASAELSIADVHWTVGDHGAATDGYLRTVDLAKRSDWTAAEATGLANLAGVQVERGELDLAGEHYRDALDRYRSLGHRAAQGVTLSNLGNVHWELGSLATAAAYFAEALALHDDLGALAPRANTLLNLGSVQHDLGRFADAVRNLSAATDLCRQIGDRADEATALEHLAGVHRDAGRYAEAMDFATAALDLAVEIRARRIEAAATNTIGTIHQREGRPDKAAERHRVALDLCATTDDRRGETDALIGIATALLDLGDAADAARHADRALVTGRRRGYRLLTARALLVLGAARLRQGNLAAATDSTFEALDICAQAGCLLGEGRARLQLGACLAATGDHARAGAEWRQAADVLSGIGAPEAGQARQPS